MSSPLKVPKYIDVDGYKCPPTFLPDLVRSAVKYQPRDTDIFVVTYPKCGTTWMVQIVLLILRRGDLPTSSEDYFMSNVFLECLGAGAVKRMQHPGCIKTHFPYRLAPFSPKAKYIYVARNPKDCCVSFYHHTKFFPMYFFSDGTFEDFFDVFIKGETEFNDYFDHLLPWYERRNEENVLFTTFERMKADHRGTVLRVAEFLGPEHLKAIERDSNLLNNIVQRSTFEYMKGCTNDWYKTRAEIAAESPSGDLSPRERLHLRWNFSALEEGHTCIGDFIRKGGIGEWESVFTVEQERRFNERIQEKTRHSDVMSLWT